MLPNKEGNILPIIEHIFHFITHFSCPILSICPPHKLVKSWCRLYTWTMFFLPRFWEQKGVRIMYHCG